MNITGKDLIAMGYKPGRWFKDVFQHLENKDYQVDELKQYLDSVAPAIIDPRSEALSFHSNIRAESELEVTNVERVHETMNEVMKIATVVNGAVMPDACPAGPIGQIPVGGIVATKNTIHPAMHSADICCSVMMTSLGFVDPKKVLDAAHESTHFGGGGRADLYDFPKELHEKLMSNNFLNNDKSIMLSRSQLGTQGDGNHFLYVGRSEQTGETVMVTHHGSRGLGARLYDHGMKVAESYRREISPETSKANAWIPYSEEHGKNYWDALQIVREWTKLNHHTLHQATFQKLGITPTLQFWNEHNFVFKDGDTFFHAKGATPLDDKFVPDSHAGLRLIPLNMSEPVLVVKGKTTTTNLGFAPHGAGRNVSRTQHKRSKGDLTKEAIFLEETAGLDARFYSGHIDITELPSAYKNAEQIQNQMKEFGLGEVHDRILPYGCIMAGDWQIDAPWRKRRRSGRSKKSRK